MATVTVTLVHDNKHAYTFYCKEFSSSIMSMRAVDYLATAIATSMKTKIIAIQFRWDAACP